MNNNDIIRRVRYAFDFNDPKMEQIFKSAGLEVSREQVVGWLKKEDDPVFIKILDNQLAYFLNGLINEKRGKKEGLLPETETRLTNNIVFKKLRVALNLQDDGVIQILKLGGFSINKSELSAFFRKPGHKNYRECKDQILRFFLKGMQVKFRDTAKEQVIHGDKMPPSKNKNPINKKRTTNTTKKPAIYRNPKLQDDSTKEKGTASSESKTVIDNVSPWKTLTRKKKNPS